MGFLLTDVLVHKSGAVEKTSDYHARKHKEWAEKTRMRNAIRGDYYKLVLRGSKHDEAIVTIMKNRQVGKEIVRYALNTGCTGAESTVEMNARALVLQDMEEQALLDFIEWQDNIIDEVMGSREEYWTIEQTDDPRGLTQKQLPKNEYLKKLLKEKLVESRESKKATSVFRRDINQVNILITESERDERMGEAAKKFGINAEFKEI